MIIKSLSRKSASYDQLLEYMQRGSVQDFTVFHNIYRNTEKDRILQEFELMGAQLPTRKNGNMLYHEILSLQRQDGVDLEQQKQALYTMVQQYLQERAPGQLGYGCMHVEKEHLHIHLMLTPNRLDRPAKRVRLTKAQLWEIQGRMEMFLQERWPELKERSLYSRSAPPALKKKDKEFQLEQRTGKPSVKSQVKEKLEVMLEQSTTQASLNAKLAEQSMQLEIRGKNPVITAGGRRYRLRTLGLLPAYERVLVLDGLAQQMKTHGNPATSPPAPTEIPPQKEPESQSWPEPSISNAVSVDLVPSTKIPEQQQQAADPVQTFSETASEAKVVHSETRSTSSIPEKDHETNHNSKPRLWKQIRNTAEKLQTIVREFRDDFHKALEQHAQSKTMESKEEPVMPPPSKDEEEKRRVEERLTRLKKAREKEQHQPTERRKEKDVRPIQRDEHRKRDQASSNRQEPRTPSMDRESQERLDRLRKMREKRGRQDRERGWERD